MNDILRSYNRDQLLALRSQVGDVARARIDVELQRRDREAAAEPPKRSATPARVARLEREEQALIHADLVKLGCKVYWLSQPRETMQTEGVPDLYVFGPGEQQATWIEVKRQAGGKISRAQSEFAARCRAAGVAHVLGDRRDVAAHFGYSYEEDDAA